MEYKRMKDEQNILSSSLPDQPDNHHHHHHHRQHKRRFCLIASVMAFTVVVSYIIVLGASFGIHQKNALLHGNYIVNSSIIIKIIVNGRNQSLSEEDNAAIFRIIGEIVDYDDVTDEDEVEDVESGEQSSYAPSLSYEEIDKTIPIARGPLRIEHPEKIPLLNGANKWKSED